MPIVTRYEVNRGRNSELARTGTGTATITMIDTNGSLDPASATAAYDPMTPVAIALTNPVTGVSSPIFRGNIKRWGYDLYETERYATATLDCVDGMEILAATEMHPSPVGGTASFGGALAGALTMHEGNIVFDKATQVKHRIDQALTQADWPIGLREIFTGNVPLKKTVYAPRSTVLEVIQDAADGEFPGIANFYIQRDGRATFHGRLARFRPLDAQYHISRWKVGDVAAVQADSSYAIIFDLDYDKDADRVINDAGATPEGIADEDMDGQWVEDAASIATFGRRSWSAEYLATDGGYLTGNDDLEETRSFAQYYVTNYAQPQTRINRIRFQQVDPDHAWGAREWAVVCGIDISDRLQVKTTHHGGASGFNDSFYFVEGLHYVVEPLNDEFLKVTLDVDVTPATYYATEPS